MEGFSVNGSLTGSSILPPRVINDIHSLSSFSEDIKAATP